ncbi:endonuclease domain-containing protein [Pseudarthrobacter sp. P1]|uniref:endonuclease domain-containing protein n=1 Tax=Pseudarthrobacter sp. P1 TaxID=3418418 RepID=UPI003CEC154A
MATFGSTTFDPTLSVLQSLGAAARRMDLLAAGVSRRRLAAAVAEGRVVLAGHGVYYALPGADPMAIHLATHQGVKACFSVAAARGLWCIRDPETPHIAVAHGRSVPGCVVHRHKGPLGLLDVLRQCIRCGTEVEALAVVESAVVLKETSISTLRAAFTGLGGAAGRRILDMLDPQSMSIIETVARYHLRRAGYSVHSQVAVRGMGHLDLMVEGILGIELDGEAYHNNAKAFEEDLRRGNVLVIRGIPTLRITGAMVLFHPEVMLGWVRAALETYRSAQG